MPTITFNPHRAATCPCGQPVQTIPGFINQYGEEFDRTLNTCAECDFCPECEAVTRWVGDECSVCHRAWSTGEDE